MEHWKVLPSTTVVEKKIFLNFRGSRVAKTITFWPWWKPLNSFCFKTLFFPLFFLYSLFLQKGVCVCVRVCVCVCVCVFVCGGEGCMPTPWPPGITSPDNDLDMILDNDLDLLYLLNGIRLDLDLDNSCWIPKIPDFATKRTSRPEVLCKKVLLETSRNFLWILRNF